MCRNGQIDKRRKGYSLRVMARMLRIEYPGVFYHVMAKGNRRETVFHDDEDRKFFLARPGEVCRMTGWLGNVRPCGYQHWAAADGGARIDGGGPAGKRIGGVARQRRAQACDGHLDPAVDHGAAPIWLANHLAMRSAANVSEQLRRFAKSGMDPKLPVGVKNSSFASYADSETVHGQSASIGPFIFNNSSSNPM